MVIVKNCLTALSAAIECARAGVAAKQGLIDGIWDSDPDWGWSHHDVQEKIDSGSAARCLEASNRANAVIARL